MPSNRCERSEPSVMGGRALYRLQLPTCDMKLMMKTLKDLETVPLMCKCQLSRKGQATWLLSVAFPAT